MTELSNFEGFIARTPLGDSQFTLASRNGDLSCLKNLFSSLKNIVGVDKAGELLSHHCNKLGKSILHESAQNSHTECVRFFVEGVKIHPDCLKQGDWTPLMLACTKNNLEIVKLLVDNGADVNLKNKDGWTAFHIACREGNVDIVKYLLNTCEKIWNTKSKNGRTPLHTSSLYGCCDTAELLLNKANYSTDETDSCGSTPLMDALRCGHVAVARILKDLQKADCAKTDILGRQALHLSAQTGQCSSIDWLIDEMKVDSNTRTTETLMTAAHFAAKENHINILRLLKEKNADLALLDDHNRSPLHLAASGQHEDCVKYLLMNGVKDGLDSFQKFAFDYAKKQNVIDAFN